ncbi:MAG: TlyA family RNA methyltransferase [Nitrospirae bacterium]|nr:TlyA family RNA methyltransferase [Nitrospirota bacterium]
MPATPKERLDKLLVERGFFSTREKAKRGILAGLISVEGVVVDKPGIRVKVEAKVEIKKNICPYVSRGGLKLEKALREFEVEVKDKVAIDIGASTGGFTDCLLQRGIRKVYAVDVGYGQLDWKLRNDERVINRERTNARYLRKEEIEKRPDLATLDVSFISLDKIIPVVIHLLNDEGKVIALIKPQFEVGKGKVSKGGVVREAGLHKEAILKIMKLAEELDLKVQGLISSPLKGPAGNREFLLYLSKKGLGLKMEEAKALMEKVVTELI